MVDTSSKSTFRAKKDLTEDRKLEHIRICLKSKVQSSTPTGFNDIQLIHSAAPELNLDDIDLRCSFLGQSFSAPLMVTAMTGGHKEATPINQNIATAVDKLDLAMGVGSQRAAIEDPQHAASFTITRTSAPTAFLVANIGAPQLALGYSVKEAEKAVAMLKANALAIHFNAAQEAVQPEGEANFAGVLPVIERLSRKVSVPLIGKETGAGLSREVASRLADAGVKALDVAGLGGTSWPAVEIERAKDEDSRKARLGRWFINWGIPTAVSTFEVAQTVKIPIIASGGIRTGIDIAKALALGATLGGVALPVLAPATVNSLAVQDYLESIIHSLKATMFLVGAANLQELVQTPLVIGGVTRNWLELRGYDLKPLANRPIQ